MHRSPWNPAGAEKMQYAKWLLHTQGRGGVGAGGGAVGRTWGWELGGGGMDNRYSHKQAATHLLHVQWYNLAYTEIHETAHHCRVQRSLPGIQRPMAPLISPRYIIQPR